MLTVSKINEKNLEDFQACLRKRGKAEIEDVLYQHQYYFLLKHNDDIIGYIHFKDEEEDVTIKEIEMFNSRDDEILMIDLLIKSVINAADMRGKNRIVIDETLVKNNVDWIKNMGFKQDEQKFHIDVKKFFSKQCTGCDKGCSH